MTDSDWLFQLKIWQVLKWIFGGAMCLLIPFLVYRNFIINEQKLQSEKTAHQWTLTAIKEILYKTHSTDKGLVQSMMDYIDKREEEIDGP